MAHSKKTERRKRVVARLDDQLKRKKKHNTANSIDLTEADITRIKKEKAILQSRI